jgi:hypothetical protein
LPEWISDKWDVGGIFSCSVRYGEGIKRWAVAYTVEVPIRAGCEGYGPNGEALTTATLWEAIHFAVSHDRRFGLGAQVVDMNGTKVWPLTRQSAVA